MKAIEKWADRIYSESDFGRSIATSLTGVVGLAIYILINDWVIAAFASIIAFPIIRIVATSFNDSYKRERERRVDEECASYLFGKLSGQELEVVQSFVKAGGSVLTWSQVNGLPVRSSAIESMISRELMWPSVMADGMKETFVLDTKIFDLGVRKYGRKSS
ncbi:hypothetical protein [Chromohalobacter canadensis]|uniref:YcxB-like protein n=1 Tax=Chromohalobacter canadensis TaxID=141389 RepID=A0ABZ0YEZ9_9GAMM|nr:hypothetical protein [Chromohalobacter canadensis]MCK0767266.1 hypothetical protein [Chromohalobacter canadensis]WQH10129.1 hypothetical protein SR908_05530 [Chromohalobacter canadensis]